MEHFGRENRAGGGGDGDAPGSAHLLHFLVRLPRRMEEVWAAVSTAEGLGEWFAAVDVLEPRLDGLIALRGLGSGRVTAWDVDRVAEYTLDDDRAGKLRFHLERDGDTGSVLRFTHEFRGEGGGTEAAWRIRFEDLVAVLERP
ncbi:SRPBCC family protein [Streptomyces sp. J2-1]|nr:SRPBCC family protein [Streptomyces corallincola]